MKYILHRPSGRRRHVFTTQMFVGISFVHLTWEPPTFVIVSFRIPAYETAKSRIAATLSNSMWVRNIWLFILLIYIYSYI